MTSAAGRCHTFDSRADGYLRGEACGAVVLAAETSALVVCLGTSARHNGQSASFTALNGFSQQLLLRAALRDAASTPGTVVEAHGTGTALGDPIEVGAISAVISHSRVCNISAIKGNLGHTESTAGVAGFLSLSCGVLECVGSQNPQLRALNPQVLRVRANTLHAPAAVIASPMRKLANAGSSSFGWSGIIAHGILSGE